MFESGVNSVSDSSSWFWHRILSLPKLRLNFLDSRQRAPELLWKILEMPELRDAHRCRCVPESVLRNDTVLRFAENQDDARFIVGMAEHVIDGGEVEIHLSRVLRLERRHLEVNHHEASKLQVVEQQIELKVLSADLKQHLVPDKSKPQAEFDEKLTQVREKTPFEGALLCFRCDSKEIEVVGVLDELLCEIGLGLREGCLEV